MSLKGERCSVPSRADVTRAPLALGGGHFARTGAASAWARDTDVSRAPLAMVTDILPQPQGARKGTAGLLVWRMLTQTAAC